MNSQIHKLHQVLIYPCLFLLALTIQAQEDKKLLIAISSQIAPYTLDLENHSGIDPEIISTVMQHVGFDVKFLPIPNSRQQRIGLNEDVDGVTGWGNEFWPGCHKTRAFRFWYNALIVPESSTITSVDSLKGKRLLTFEGAHEHIDEYAKIALDAESIATVNDSFQAGRLIRAGRVDAYMGDYPAYFYHLAKNYDQVEARKLTKVVKFFNVNHQKICFRDRDIRDKFDDALDQLIDEKIFHKIYSKYSPDILPSLYPTKRR